MLKFHISIVLTCDELVLFFSDETSWYQFFTCVTKSSHVWRIGGKSSHLWKIGIKSSHVEKLASKLTRVKNWYQILTHMKKVVLKYHRCEELVLNRHRCQCQNWEELESNHNAADLGGILSMWGILMYAIRNLTSCVFFTKCEICDVFVSRFHVLWGIGTNYSKCEIYKVWNLRFNKLVIRVIAWTDCWRVWKSIEKV